MAKAAPKILLAVTGSIAAVKAPEMVTTLIKRGFTVRCVMTTSAAQFVTPMALATLSGHAVEVDMFGPNAHTMPHVTLSKWADKLLIAPASASTIARCAHGLGDDLVSLCYLTTQAPTIMAPALHDTMWNHPAVQQNVKVLKTRGVKFIGPIKGKLANGDEAVGRMTEPLNILQVL